MQVTLETKDLSAISEQLDEFRSLQEPLPPHQHWFTLEEACFYKRGLSWSEKEQKWENKFLKWCWVNKWGQPNGGREENVIGGKGKRVWSKATILAWLPLGDEDLKPKEKANQ